MYDKYDQQISELESDYELATRYGVNRSALHQLQLKLDIAAQNYADNQSLGYARYKLYQLQALISFSLGDNLKALAFIDDAISTYGHEYRYASDLKRLILEADQSSEPDGNAKRRVDYYVQLAALVILVLEILFTPASQSAWLAMITIALLVVALSMPGNNVINRAANVIGGIVIALFVVGFAIAITMQ